MKNLFSNVLTSFTFDWVKRVGVLCVFLCATSVVFASQHTLKLTVSPHSDNTGSGKVYVYDDATKQQGTDEFECGSIEIEISKTTSGSSSFTFKPKVKFEAKPGSRFEGVYNGTTWLKKESDNYHKLGDVTSSSTGVSYGDYGLFEAATTIYVKFTKRNYQMSSPLVYILTQDASGNIIPDNLDGGKIGWAINNPEVEANSNKPIPGGTVYTQPADDCGQRAEATFTHYYVASANTGYEFVGWATDASATSSVESTNPIKVTTRSSYEEGVRTGDVPQADTYYAVFRRKYIGYNQPCAINISGTGQISADNSSWSATNITHTPTTAHVSSVTQPPIKVNYYAKVTDATFAFAGWFDQTGNEITSDRDYSLTENGDIYTCTYTYNPIAEISDDLKCPPTLTARFVPNNYYYENIAVVSVDPEQSEWGDVFVDDGTVGSIANVQEWADSKTFGNSEIMNHYQFAYTYYAKPAADGLAFKEWYITKTSIDPNTHQPTTEEIVLSDEPVFTYAVDYTNLSWNSGEENAITPPEVYARFQVSTHYYHGRAKVGVARESEVGQVFVSNEETPEAQRQWYTPTDGAPLYTSAEEVVDNDGDTKINEDVIETLLNENRYNYYYYAKPSESSAFIGWSTSINGETITSTDNPYIPQYTAWPDKDNPHVPVPLYAVFRSYYHTIPRVVSIGSGTVKVGDGAFQQEINSTEPIAVPATGNYHAYTYPLTAKPNSGASFLGWSTSDSQEDIVSQSLTYTLNGRTSVTNRNTPQRMLMYALFESDVKIKHIDRMIYYNEGKKEYINDITIVLEVRNAKKLVASLSGNMTDFELVPQDLTQQGTSLTLDATNGIVAMRLKYIGNDSPLSGAIGKETNITFNSYDENDNLLASNGKVVVVEEAPIVTFLPPDGKGTYTVSLTDGSGITYTLGDDTQEALHIDVTHESKSYLRINLTDKAGDGMAFFAWQIIENYGKPEQKISYLSYDKLYTYHFTKAATIRPEFIPETWARYIIKSNPELSYYDLNEAIQQAKVGVSVEEKTIVVNQDGLLPKGTYTIPRGVTLLVPGTSDYISRTTTLNKQDYIVKANYGDINVPEADRYNDADFVCYRKLTVENGTRITVQDGGNICVYAKLVLAGQTVLGFPMKYGMLELGNGAMIDLESGASLYAWGYITNSSDTKVSKYNVKEVGGVNVQSGAQVWESFSYRDFRGGSRTIDFVELSGLASIVGGAIGDPNGYKHQVFPINQYYLQNVEAPLRFNSGSKHSLMFTFFANDVITTSTFTFVDNATGLFQWKTNTASLTKYYDASTDRLNYIIEDKQSSIPSVEMSSISLTMNVLGYDIDLHSRNYVMPFTNNMDIELINACANIGSGINIGLLAGSTINIDSNSKLKNNGALYVYDSDQNYLIGTNGNKYGYYGSTDSELLTVLHRPYSGWQSPRTTDNLKDASVVVDGVLDNSNGYFITTKDGANIISNGGGQIILNKFGTPATGSGGSLKRNQSIYQYNQNADTDESGSTVYLSSGYHAIPLSTSGDSKFYPKLHNNNGTYADATTAGTYYYCNGTWSTNSCTETPTVEADYTPRFTVATPTISTYVGEGIWKQPLAITEDNTDNAPSAGRTYSADFTGRDANLFTFNEETKDLTFNPASAGTKTAVMILKATYTQNGVEYVHSVAIDLTATAQDQKANTLAFNDFSTLWEGQTEVALYKGKNNSNDVIIVVTGNNGYISEITDGKFDAYNEGTVTVTISQDQDDNNHVAATSITTTITVHPRVVWNWSELYYPSVNTNPITMMDGSTGWTLTEVIDKESGDVVKFTGGGSTNEHPKSTYTAEIFDLINGEYKVSFTFKQDRHEDITFKSVIYSDPRLLRVDVNNATVFRGVTVGEAKSIEYSEKGNYVSFGMNAGNDNPVWTIHFLGIPDKLHFIPDGDGKAWQIEESSNGITWATTMPWRLLAKSQPFEYSLMPSTQYVRISYGAHGYGRMTDVYITKLEGVKLEPAKLYMPARQNETKHVAVTYVSTSDVTISDPNEEFLVDQTTLPKTNAAEPYYSVQDVLITNQSCTAEKLTNINIEASSGTIQLPIQTFKFPQNLPIVLASDHKERYYYVTTNNYNAVWEEETRTIELQNAVANAQPFVTFHYNGAPSYIEFNHTKDIQGEWIIEESSDGLEWRLSTSEPTTSNGYFKQPVSLYSKHIRVTYNSLYAEKVDITNLKIIGDMGAFATPTELTVKYEDENKNFKDFTVTAISLANGMTIDTDNENFKLTYGEHNMAASQSISLDKEQYPEVFKNNAMEEIPFRVYFNGAKAVDYATITIKDIPSEGATAKTLAIVQVTGVRETLSDGEINVYTGVPTDRIDVSSTFESTFEGYNHRMLKINDAFADGKALFDYIYIFGETTTMDGTSTINTPTTIAGSNAKTPCYIYRKSGDNYVFYDIIENANASTKVAQDFLQLTDAGAETLKVYITGFCPYVSTGYTKQDEGAFFFQGGENDHIHVYVEDCYLYSRAKTEDGHFFENRSDGRSFTESYVRGSGAVFVFECRSKDNQVSPFQATIHTRGTNLLKSHYGCFLESVAGRAFQASSPVQIHMQTDEFIPASYTTLNFTDEWPIANETERTNGFLSLQKQVNNAPSIDMGNAKTVVNFNGGRVELENAQNVSDNYTTTMAISHRSGKFAGFLLAYGLGSDDVGGTVNFNDGTTTVKRMEVDERYRQYYLMEEDGIHTSCLRTPANTFVKGGSHCMMRACNDPTNKGGAPTDGKGNALGLYKYPYQPTKDGETVTKKGGWNANGKYGLVTPTYPPSGYNIESIAPNTNGTTEGENASEDDYLNFWVTPDYDSSVNPEVDQKASFWKACMTYIAANYAGYGGAVGGDVLIETKGGQQAEMVSNLLYCEIDDNIKAVIANDYSAPVKSPLPSGDPYLYIKPSEIGNAKQHYILNEQPYRVENKLYYITTATADVWTSFTAPFDVRRVYIMETRHEADLKQDATVAMEQDNTLLSYRTAMLKMQAKHNADFAAFFGVAMVIHPNKTFDMIFADYIEWAKKQDKVDISKRDKYELVHYNPNVVDGNDNQPNGWDKADYYLYKNNGPWIKNGNKYETAWEFVAPATDDQPLMEKGETYSMLFPYCTSCFDNSGDRDFWDYWTGKFLIFESMDGGAEGHMVNGADFAGVGVDYETDEKDVTRITNVEWEELSNEGLIYDLSQLESGERAVLSGNSTFAKMITRDQKVFAYNEIAKQEGFTKTAEELIIEPTTSFLYANVIVPPEWKVKSILRTGEIVYDTTGNGTTGGNIPTVGGGNDLFITKTAGGINVAVAAPQQVRVISSTGAVLYSGMVQTSVDVTIPTTGVYVVTGENEAQKILY